MMKYRYISLTNFLLHKKRIFWQKTFEGKFWCVYSDSFELVVLTEQIEGEEGLDLEDHLFLVRQRVVADRVRHHHCQLKLHREKTVLPTLGKVSGTFGG
jgi:hypothetical protein